MVLPANRMDTSGEEREGSSPAICALCSVLRREKRMEGVEGDEQSFV